MKWILCGKNDAAAAALEFLVDRGDEVWAIGSANDPGTSGWQRSLRDAARRAGVAFDQPERINAPAFVERLAGFGASALLSIQYDQILRGRLLRAIGCPCLNFHFALLPRHRGVAPIAWALLEGDAQAGVTLHLMVEDIDAGDVLAQRALPIGPGDSAREVYDKVSEAAIALFRESYPFPPDLLTRRLSQDASAACYHRNGDIDFSRRRIDWGRPAEELHRWLRAMIFPPMQYPETGCGARILAVSRVAGGLGERVEAPPGAIVARDDDAIEVAAGDRSVRICGLVDPARPALGTQQILESLEVGGRLA